MKLARIATPEGPKPAILDGDTWAVITDMFADELHRTGETHPVEGTKLLAPCEPLVVLGMAHNTGAEDRKIPPQAFLKTPRTVVGPGEPIELDPSLGRIFGEGELTIVIRKTARRLKPEDVPGVILGFTIGNDVTNVDQIPNDEKMTQVKNGDGYTPIGPWIDTEIDWSNAPIHVDLDGERVADASSADLAWNIIEQLVYLTKHLTLGPGDIVMTGAPFTSAELTPGKRMDITIDGIGTLSNPVIGIDPIA
ncbi:fumarylacetoacetate hydrolase family protein [Arcanobacterium haemolyticum]|nr:fumarylacetoacetate hydrolase family protein [Arcanobacterium haemolyticum]